MLSRLLCLLSVTLAPPVLADVFTFETPSGNIDCSVGMGEAASDISCTIFERTGPPARPKPSDCGAGWGHRFLMRSTGPVTMECGGPGQNLKMFEVAPYGLTSADWDGISCTSTEQGLECLNADGHGFFLSRRAQRVF